MAKSIIKELIIVLLLCLAIILILGILLYEYVPITKTVPNEVAYTTPSDVKSELLSSSDADENKIIMTYEVNQDDLNNYKKIQEYKPGKANPFAGTSTETQNTTNGNNTTTNGSSNTGSSKNTTTSSGSSTSSNTTNDTTAHNNETNDNTTSGGHYFQNKGIK